MWGGLAPPGFVVVFVVVGEGLAPPAGAGLAPPAGAGLAPPGFLAFGQMEFPSTEIPSNGNGFVVWLARHPPLATSSETPPLFPSSPRRSKRNQPDAFLFDCAFALS